MAVSRGLIIFDCDGTLVDSQANICLAMEDAFARARLEPPERSAIRRVVGLNLVEAMAVLLPDADGGIHLHMAEDYKQAFQRLRGNGLIEEPLFPGIADLIARLDEDGWLLGVATGKSDRGLRLCLDRHNMAHHFVTLQTADRHPSKPHPAMLHAAIAEAGEMPARTWMIGDTVYDIHMGVAAGVRAVGVDWGYHHPDELIEAGAVAVLEQPAELVPYIEEIAR